MMLMETRILWQRLDIPGHEICVLDGNAEGWQLEGTALVAHDGCPCRLNYRIQCDIGWHTKSVLIDGQVGRQLISLEITRSLSNEWHSNGVPVPAVEGCIDVDLGFSPSTNLLPIRRLTLAIGSRATVRAAWVRFPELSVELLEQVYTRLDSNRYRYESANGAFRRDLLTSPDGFVLEYPDYWRTEALMSAGS
jgi:hypothetical protein